MRSMAARSSGSSRRYSMKPVGLPMELAAPNSRHIARVFFERRHDRIITAQARLLHAFERLQDALVIFGHYLDKFRRHVFPVRQYRGSTAAVGIGLVALDHFPERLNFVRVFELFESHHLR